MREVRFTVEQWDRKAKLAKISHYPIDMVVVRLISRAEERSAEFGHEPA